MYCPSGRTAGSNRCVCVSNRHLVHPRANFNEIPEEVLRKRGLAVQRNLEFQNFWRLDLQFPRTAKPRLRKTSSGIWSKWPQFDGNWVA